MLLNNFFRIHMPYCLDLQEDGSYVVLNREYKPVGFQTTDCVDYDAYPVKIQFKNLSEATIKKLSANGRYDSDRIYLYSDSSMTLSSNAKMDAYLARLKLLMNWKVKPEPKYPKLIK